MRREAATLLSLPFFCQLCLLVFSGGPVQENAPSLFSANPGYRETVGGILHAAVDHQGPSVCPPFQVTLNPQDPAIPGAAPLTHPPIKGVYATGYSAGSARRFPEIIDFISETEVNALVIDVKDDTGLISYPSQVPLAVEIGAGKRKFSPEKVLGTLAEKNIYPIARIVAFKDPYLAAKRPDLAVKSKSGGLWKDDKGQLWVDPYNQTVWNYLVDLAKEAAAKGFKEIQFDYVRFTSDGKLSDCVYPAADGRSKDQVIRDFLLYARQELEPLGVVLSADVFGLTCTALGDLGIGQHIEEIAEGVDIVSPMVYPSHFYKGTYGLADPDAEPYETVLHSLSDACRRLAGMGVKIRPWLQDFSLGHKYGRAELMAQIKAVNDAGLTEWIFWNPSNSYDVSNYNQD